MFQGRRVPLRSVLTELAFPLHKRARARTHRMATPYSEEELRAACEARGLAADGDAAALHDRLGAALVDDLLRSRRRPKRRPPPTSPTASRAAWLAFL